MKKTVLIISAIVMVMGAGCSRSEEKVSTKKASRSEGGLQVIHTPLNINDVPKELIQKMNFPYVRFYRTEVSNNADRPVKIIWFDAYFSHDGNWSGGNVRNKVLRNSDFMDWHTHQDMDKDGWIRPGGRATCLVNWHWTDTPEEIQLKWAYIGVDAYGYDYFAEAIVPEIKPEKLK